MPAQTFLILLVSVLAAAGATVALVWAIGISFAWLGLGALGAALAVRRWA